MGAGNRQLLLDRTLTRAADTHGDITPVAMHDFYTRFPGAQDAFERLWPGRRPELEGQMIQTVLYCVMHWIEARPEVEIILFGTIPHHSATLGIEMDWFYGLFDAVMDVIASPIPEDGGEERQSWDRLRAEIRATIDMGAL